MKICFIGNPQTVHLQRRIKYFIGRGHEVHVITPQPAEIEGVHMHEISLAAFYDIPTSFFYKLRIISYIPNLFRRHRLIRQTKKIIEKIKPDILDAHYLTYYGVFASQLDFHPLVITVWGSDILIDIREYGKEHAILMKRALEKADLITCDGENIKESMVNLDVNPKKIKLIFHGVDTRKFNSKQNDAECIKNLFGEGNLPVIISARSLVPKNDMETLIKAVPLILKKSPDAKFIIAGEGPEEIYLKKLAESIGNLNSIKFVGWISHEDLPKYLASSDVYVSTSLWDGGISVATLDAMACELPSVVTDVADNKEWVKDGRNGFIVPTKSPGLLAEKVIYLIKNEDIRKKFGKFSRKIVEEKHDYYKEMAKMEKLYKTLIEG